MSLQNKRFPEFVEEKKVCLCASIHAEFKWESRCFQEESCACPKLEVVVELGTWIGLMESFVSNASSLECEFNVVWFMNINIILKLFIS